MATQQFYKDLAAARSAEKIALQQLALHYPHYHFEDVSDDSSCYYKGDIKLSNDDGAALYVEVKNDSRIAETGNILCEYGNYFKSTNRFSGGAMKNNTDIYCVVSQAARRIYLFKFDVLAKNYKSGKHKIIHHAEQDSYCYLLPIEIAAAAGALITTIDY